MKIKVYTLHTDTQFGRNTCVSTSKATRDLGALELVESYDDEDRHGPMAALELGSPEWHKLWEEFASDQIDDQNYFHIDEDEIEMP